MGNRFWHNFSWQTINYGVSGLLLVGLWVLLARYWSVAEFGRFNALFALAAIYGLVMEFGLDFYVTKQTALIDASHSDDSNDSDAANSQHNPYSHALVAFRCTAALLTGVVFVAIGWWLDYPLLPLVLFIVGAFTLNLAHFFCCYLRGIEKLSVEAIISLIRNIAFVVLAFVGVSLGQSVVWVAGCYFAVNVVFIVASFAVIKRYQFTFAQSGAAIGRILTTTLPVWIASLLFGMTIKLDILLLEQWGSTEALGHFSSAARIFEGCLLVATAYVLTYFPQLSRYATSQMREYPSFVFKSAKLLLLLAVVGSVLGIVIGADLFVWLYGPSYQAAEGIFRQLIYLLPISIMVVFFYNALIIAAKSTQVVALLLFALLMQLLLDGYLIPLYQGDGAFYGLLVKESFLLLSFCYLLLGRWNE